MDNNQIIIYGGKPLTGKVKSSGAKNAALKMIAATLLTKEQVILHNVPLIADVIVILELLIGIGAEIQWISENSISIKCDDIDVSKLDQNKVGRLRASVVLIGPLLARFKSLRIHEPGGCVIGTRQITTLVNALKQLGVKVSKQGKYYLFDAKNIQASRIVLDEMSVTTTETILMTASLFDETTQIHSCATEPEIENLAQMLIGMGVEISGINTSILTIKGSSTLKGFEISVIPDRIEIASYACAIIGTGGEAIIEDVIPNHLSNLLNKFTAMGVIYSFSNPLTTSNGDQSNNLILKSSPNIKPIKFDTRPYPGFSTDLQAPMVALLTQASGTSEVFETIFEGRLDYVKSLIKMGANIEIINNRIVKIHGPTKLSGSEIDTPDLRAGASFVIAALIASGKTIINNAKIIDRGYEKMDEKLRLLGSAVERV